MILKKFFLTTLGKLIVKLLNTEIGKLIIEEILTQFKHHLIKQFHKENVPLNSESRFYAQMIVNSSDIKEFLKTDINV